MSYHPGEFGDLSHSVSGVGMILVCHGISQGHEIKWSCYFLFYGWDHLMVRHHPAKFGSHSCCVSGVIMFSVAKEEDSRCPRFSPTLLFVSKGRGLKAHCISINDFDPGHTCLKQKLKKNLKITCASPSKNAVEKNEEKKIMVIAKLFAKAKIYNNY